MQSFAVFGNPIAQSKSPFIHHRFAEQAGIEITYEAKLVPTSEFAKHAMDFFEQPMNIGANVTAPFKEDAFKLASVLTDEAKTAGAVNTLYKTVDGLMGHNTDGLGLIQDIMSQDQLLENKRILIIGAGGAARGVIKPFLNHKVADLRIVNRNAKRAKDLAAFIGDKKVTASSMDGVKHEHFDIVINATTLSLQKSLPDLPKHIYSQAAFVYDMVYLPGETTFIAEAKRLGCPKTSDGLGMLVGQAAKSFELWMGRRVDTTPVLKALRAELNQQ